MADDDQVDWLIKARSWAATNQYGVPPKTNLDAVHAFALMSIAEDLRKLVDFVTTPLPVLEPQTATRAPDDFDTNPVAWQINADENPATYDD